MGADRVRPPDWLFAILTTLLILVPSMYVLIYINIQLFGLVFGLIIDSLYLVSLLNLVRLIYLCATTDPGIIPAIPSESVKTLYEKHGRIGVYG